MPKREINLLNMQTRFREEANETSGVVLKSGRQVSPKKALLETYLTISPSHWQANR